MSENTFSSAAGSFELSRYPSRRREPLRAWNSADLLLVEQAMTRSPASSSCLVVNDEQGALSVSLNPVATWTDSALSTIAITQNCKLNGLDPVPIIPGIETTLPLCDITAMKIPKSLPYFEYQLTIIAHNMARGHTLLAAGMDKHLSPRTATLLERYIGPTERLHGRHKARVFVAHRDDREAASVPQTVGYEMPQLEGKIQSLASVFSREQLDMGSSFLLSELSRLETATHILDLACGNGVLGLYALSQGLGQTAGFCDESSMAVESAQINARALLPQRLVDMHFFQGDGLQGYSGPQADLILCNPPFHSQHVVDDFVGRRLLEQAAAYLGSAGRLCIVANRHLDYLPTLRRGFVNVEKLAQNKKFIIWLAHKTRN